jgi:hypothetical protein
MKQMKKDEKLLAIQKALKLIGETFIVNNVDPMSAISACLGMLTIICFDLGFSLEETKNITLDVIEKAYNDLKNQKENQ